MSHLIDLGDELIAKKIQLEKGNILELHTQIRRIHLPWRMRVRFGQIKRKDIRHFD
jgi:hypothetical protein